MKMAEFQAPPPKLPRIDCTNGPSTSRAAVPCTNGARNGLNSSLIAKPKPLPGYNLEEETGDDFLLTQADLEGELTFLSYKQPFKVAQNSELSIFGKT